MHPKFDQGTAGPLQALQHGRIDRVRAGGAAKTPDAPDVAKRAGECEATLKIRLGQSGESPPVKGELFQGVGGGPQIVRRDREKRFGRIRPPIRLNVLGAVNATLRTTGEWQEDREHAPARARRFRMEKRVRRSGFRRGRGSEPA